MSGYQMNIQWKIEKTIEDVVSEICFKNWKQALDAVHDLASMMKNAGMGSKPFNLMMENLENEVIARSGIELFDEWRQVLANKEHYMAGNVIYLPTRVK